MNERYWNIIKGINEDEDVHFLDQGRKFLLIAMDTINEGYHFEKWWAPVLIHVF